MTGNILEPFDRYVTYTIDADDGQSGAPLHDIDNYVLGVHSCGDKELNYGARISQHVFDICYDTTVNY